MTSSLIGLGFAIGLSSPSYAELFIRCPWEVASHVGDLG